ncbi:MAG: peptidase S58 family protein [Alphaproteobacteria bacterium]|nr:MAG: peptidase S58 family protein [Alphaproteobacteria bacterium]
MRPGPRNLITDVAGLAVGNAHDARLRSGVTVLTAARPFTAAVQVMGGAPGTRETDLLAPDKLVAGVDALVLSGGSAFGLAACDGVAEALREAGRGFEVAGQRVPIVPGAILFDLANGGAKDWARNPYPGLGRAALAAAGPAFAIGSAGAGFGARAGRWRGGLGSASAVLASGITVGALVAVNAVGDPVVGAGPHFWAGPFEIGEEFGGLGPAPAGAHDPAAEVDPLALRHGAAGGQTTIAIVATDAALDPAQAQRVAAAAHDGIARALLPAHTPFDGDLVFAAATGARPLADPPREVMMIGHAAALCLARAIARAVHAAAPSGGIDAPAWCERFGAAGAEPR